MNHEKFMKAALAEAQKADKKEEVPVGAVAVVDGKIIARAHNQREELQNPVAHAELLCLQKAAKKLGGWRLNKVTLYSTLEPCPMCAGAIVASRVNHVVFGTKDHESGTRGVKVKVTSGILEKDCKAILQQFFKKIRKGG